MEHHAGIDVSLKVEQRVHRGAGSAFADKIKILTTEGEVTGDHSFVGRGGHNTGRTPRVSATAALPCTPPLPAVSVGRFSGGQHDALKGFE